MVRDFEQEREDLREEILEDIENVLNGMWVDEQYGIYKEYSINATYYDEEPFTIDEIDEFCCGLKPLEILERFEGIDLSWDYFCFDAYGNVEEWEGISDADEVAEWMLDNEEDCSCNEIRNIIDDYIERLEEIDEAEEEADDEDEDEDDE